MTQRSPFREWYEYSTEAAMPWMLLLFIVLINLQALGDIIDGVSGLVDWLSVLILTLTGLLVLMFAQLLLRRWWRQRSGGRS